MLILQDKIFEPLSLQCLQADVVGWRFIESVYFFYGGKSSDVSLPPEVEQRGQTFTD